LGDVVVRPFGARGIFSVLLVSFDLLVYRVGYDDGNDNARAYSQQPVIGFVIQLLYMAFVYGNFCCTKDMLKRHG